MQTGETRGEMTRAEYAKQAREFFLEFFYRDEADLVNWEPELGELEWILFCAYRDGVRDALGAAPGLSGRDYLRIQDQLCALPEGEQDVPSEGEDEAP